MKQSTPSELFMPRANWRAAYRLRLKRKRLLWRAFRARRHLSEVRVRQTSFRPDDVVAVCVLRNEASRLPYFLEYYRGLGVAHFLMVDNGSDDGSDAYLCEQSDVSLWQTPAGYRDARFGLDWATWLQRRYCHGHWCLTVDADELLVFDGAERASLPELTQVLARQGRLGFGALMLDLYPKGALSGATYTPGQSPLEVLDWFDRGPYRAVRQSPLGNLWLQGGVRERVFFSTCPNRSPTLNKIPLVKWDRSFAYVNSTHSILPRHLNAIYDGLAEKAPAGVLLHTKFLPEVVSKSETEKERQQHFHTPQEFDDYYQKIMEAPDMWCAGSQRYEGVEQLIALGLMPKIAW